MLRAALVVLWGVAAGCFQASPQTGGETHFMHTCESDCAAGLECVCGVCTLPCEERAACAELSAEASCAEVNADSAACESGSVPARACVLACSADGDCAQLGEGFTCVDWQCRQGSSASGTPVFATTPDDSCQGRACAVAEQPLVMLLVDSSGSMERKTSCTCTTPSCMECVPDCASAERNRWVEVLEALGGTFEDYSCEAIERTKENGATFDVGYYMPHFAPRGVQGDDGVLDVYRDRVRFGLATFDGWDTYVGADPTVPYAVFDYRRSLGVEGLWSYNPYAELAGVEDAPDVSRVGAFRYPGTIEDYFVDSGIRSARAEQGALLAATEPARAAEINDLIQSDLAATRPYGGTPIAGSLDDLYYYMRHDPSMAVERARPAAKYIVLMTDGYPNTDFREVGCDCALEMQSADRMPCGGDPRDPKYDPALMRCPYPTAQEAAQVLRCGPGEVCDGPVERLYVAGFAVDDQDTIDELNRVARAGGSERARFASGAAELRAQLAAILAEIE